MNLEGGIVMIDNRAASHYKCNGYFVSNQLFKKVGGKGHTSETFEVLKRNRQNENTEVHFLRRNSKTPPSKDFSSDIDKLHVSPQRPQSPILEHGEAGEQWKGSLRGNRRGPVGDLQIMV